MSSKFALSTFMAAAPLLLAAGILTSGTEPAKACGCCGTYQVTGVAYNDVLNIRSGPSVKYRIVGSIPPGSACVVRTGPRRGKWVKVSYAFEKGWVNSRYLRWKK